MGRSSGKHSVLERASENSEDESCTAFIRALFQRGTERGSPFPLLDPMLRERHLEAK